MIGEIRAAGAATTIEFAFMTPQAFMARKQAEAAAAAAVAAAEAAEAAAEEAPAAPEPVASEPAAPEAGADGMAPPAGMDFGGLDMVSTCKILRLMSLPVTRCCRSLQSGRSPLWPLQMEGMAMMDGPAPVSMPAPVPSTHAQRVQIARQIGSSLPSHCLCQVEVDPDAVSPFASSGGGFGEEAPRAGGIRRGKKKKKKAGGDASQSPTAGADGGLDAAEVERLAAEAAAAEAAAAEEAAMVAAEEEDARIAAEQEAARIATERDAARIAAEEEATRIAAQSAENKMNTATAQLVASLQHFAVCSFRARPWRLHLLTLSPCLGARLHF